MPKIQNEFRQQAGKRLFSCLEAGLLLQRLGIDPSLEHDKALVRFILSRVSTSLYQEKKKNSKRYKKHFHCNAMTLKMLMKQEDLL